MNKLKKIPIGPMFIIIAALLWALDGVIRRNLYSLPPLTIIFFEHIVGLIILLPFVYKNLIKEKIGRRELFLLLVIALLSGLLGTLWFTTALLKINFISFSVVFLLQKLQPIFAISSARVFLKEKISKQYIPWAVLALVSAYFVTFKNGIINLDTGEGTIIAAIYALGASFAWGTSTTFSKMLLNKVSTKVATFYRFFFTIIMAFVLILLTKQASVLALPTIPQLGLFVIIALSTGMVALYLYYKGLARTPVHISTILELTFPFIAILIDIFLYDSYLSMSQWVATIILVFSIYRIVKLQNSYVNS
jgi:drug/metabolite transporter (DMT)-like permease